MFKKVVWVTLALLALGVVFFIVTVRKSQHIIGEKYGLAAYSKLGIEQLFQKYDEELKAWPLLYLDRDFRELYRTLKHTASVVKKSR